MERDNCKIFALITFTSSHTIIVIFQFNTVIDYTFMHKFIIIIDTRGFIHTHTHYHHHSDIFLE